MAYSYKHFLFSHAGVTKPWLENHGYSGGPVADFVNDLFFYQPDRFRFQAGTNHSRTGDDITQSPIWVRPPSVRLDGIDGFTQVVGHTQQEHIRIESGLILVDALAGGEFLCLQDKQGVIDSASSGMRNTL